MMKKKLLRMLLVLCLTVTMLPTVSLAADRGACGDNLTWKIENGTLTISGTGKMTD